MTWGVWPPSGVLPLCSSGTAEPYHRRSTRTAHGSRGCGSGGTKSNRGMKSVWGSVYRLRSCVLSYYRPP